MPLDRRARRLEMDDEKESSLRMWMYIAMREGEKESQLMKRIRTTLEPTGLLSRSDANENCK